MSKEPGPRGGDASGGGLGRDEAIRRQREIASFGWQ
jgi:hypothetical protein